MNLYNLIQEKIFQTYEEWHMKNPIYDSNGFHIVGIDNSLKAMQDGYIMYTEIYPPHAINGCTSMKAVVGKSEEVLNLYMEINGKKYAIFDLSYGDVVQIMRTFVKRSALPDEKTYTEVLGNDNEKIKASFTELSELLIGDSKYAQSFLKRVKPENMEDIEIVGINWRNSDLDYIVYMLKYDSTFGRFPGTVEKYENGIVVNGKKIPVYMEDDAKNIPWGECGAEYIVEGTGAYNTTEKAQAHIEAGAKKVIISAPAKDKATPTFVYGVNHDEYDSNVNVVSNASCTTNCLAPLCKVINDNWGIDQGLMSTIHAATAKQKVVDARSMKDWRTGRSVFNNIIPTTTGAAKAVSLVIPELEGKLTGKAYRVPTADVSVIDLNLILKNSASYEEICAKVKEASENEFKGIIEYVDDEVVSCDFIGDPCTCIYDAREGIELNDKFFKFIMFYDNEYGYSVQLLRLIQHMGKVDNK